VRCFFHLEYRNCVLRDETGENFPNIEQAIAYAVGVARELARNRPDRVSVGQRILVTDVGGIALFRVPLRFARV